MSAIRLHSTKMSLNWTRNFWNSSSWLVLVSDATCRLLLSPGALPVTFPLIVWLLTLFSPFRHVQRTGQSGLYIKEIKIQKNISKSRKYMANHINTWQYMANHSNTWQFTAIHGNSQQYMAIHSNTWQYMVNTFRRVMQYNRIALGRPYSSPGIPFRFFHFVGH